MSACCWVKLNSITNNNYPYIFALGSNTTGKGIQIGLAIWKSDSKLHLIGHGAEPASNYMPPLNTWIHLCMTISGTSTKLYVNGILTDTQTNSNSPKTQNCLCIGARSNSISGAGVSFSYPLNGYINDFRLYDHALSPMEVKQISQGLILHYLLNAKNLFNYHTTTYAKSFAPNGNIQNTSGWAISDYIPIFPNQSYLGIGLSAGGSNTYAVLYDINKNQTRTILEVANQNLIINSNQNEYYIRLSIRDFNHELTTTAKFLENNNIQYDTSGYKNNGTKNNITYISDSPKYKVSSSFSGSNNYIKVNENNWISQGSEAMTVNFWAYSTDWSTRPKLISCTQSGGWNTQPGNTGYLRVPIHVYTNSAKTSTAYKYSSNEIKVSDLQAGWHMFTIVYDSTGNHIYLDGLPHSSYNFTSYGIHYNMNARLFIGCEASTASPASPYFKGNMSDVRIYCTALSAEDVLSLYNNSAYIDNQGNIYGAIYEEV